MAELVVLVITFAAVIVVSIYISQTRKRPDLFQSRRERYRMRRERAPDRPIDPTFQFDNSPDPEPNDKPSGPS